MSRKLIPIFPASPGKKERLEGSKRSAATLLKPVPLSLYIHFPWCIKKCPYCDFNSHTWRGESFPETQYVQALEADLERALPSVWGRSVQSVFIGGGTPSLLSPEAVDRLLMSVRTLLPLSPDAEVTMEANPGTFEASRFAGFAQAGVNRLSIGVQTFCDQGLKVLGRVHDANQSLAAIRTALKCFERVNLDLMYAWPGQQVDHLRSDLVRALSEGPSHLSVYQLTLEPNTWFSRYPPVLPEESVQSEMDALLVEILQQAGWQRYEVSAWALSVADQCRHNLNYWQFGDYLGIGAGAHSKLSFPGQVRRQVRFKQPERYMAAVLGAEKGDVGQSEWGAGMPARDLPGEVSALQPAAFSERNAQAGYHVESEYLVPSGDLPFEFFLNVLRLSEGVPMAFFAERTGLSLSTIDAELRVAHERGFLAKDPLFLRASPIGFQFLNNLQALFLPAVC